MLDAQSRSNRGLLLCNRGDFRAGLRDMEEAYHTREDVSPEEEEAARKAIESMFPADAFANPHRISASGLAKVGAHPGVNNVANSFILQLSGAGYFHRAIEIGERFVTGTEQAIQYDQPLMQDFCRDAYLGLCNAYTALGHPELAEQWRQQALDTYQTLSHQLLIVATLHKRLLNLILYDTENIRERHQITEDKVSIVMQVREIMPTDDSASIHAVPVDLLEGHWDRPRSLIRRPGGVRRWPFARPLLLQAIGTLAPEDNNPDAAWDEVRRRFPNLRPDEPGNANFDVSVSALQIAASLSLDADDLENARMWIEALEHWLDWSGAVIGRAEASLLRLATIAIIDDPDNAHRSCRISVHQCQRSSPAACADRRTPPPGRTRHRSRSIR